MKRPFLPTLSLLVLGLGIAGFAPPTSGAGLPASPGQQGQWVQAGPSQPRAPGTQPETQPGATDPAGAQRITVTGCLAKATQPNQYTVTDASSHQQYTFPAPNQLDNYLNHTVKLTGTLQARENGDKIFHPETIASVASSCS